MANIYMTSSNLINLSNEELCTLYQQGVSAAMDALCVKNARLVHKAAIRIMNEYKPESLTEEDLYIEGNMGLITAASKFEESLGYKFSTYACWWIQQAITREVMNCGYSIRIPVHVFEQIIVVNNCRKSKRGYTFSSIMHTLNSKFDREFSEEDVRTLIGYSDKMLRGCSLNKVITDGNSETELMDMIASETTVEDEVMEHMTCELIDEVLGKLGARERDVIRLRYGLNGNCKHTLEEVGDIYGVTRERIRQIEAKAIKKLANGPKSYKLKGLLAA